jgi:diguanylate cyclase (GGDEF)-like protein
MSCAVAVLPGSLVAEGIAVPEHIFSPILGPPAAQSLRQATSTALELPRCHILCIEDDEGQLQLLGRQVEAQVSGRAVVHLHRSGAVALQWLADLQRSGESIAMVLAGDVVTSSQPGQWSQPGLDFLTEVHRHLPQAAKVLLTTAASSAALGEVFSRGAAQAGLSHLLLKPVAEPQLRLMVESLLLTHALQHTQEQLVGTLREQQRELDVLNLNLESRIRERTMALEEANRRLSQLAVTDGLTGLYNHRYLQEHLVLEVERSLRTGIPLGMLMVDVDHFRLYNNRFGHQTGDDVLRRVARLIGEHRRVNDVVARYGGEEFALLLINADHRVAANIAERLRARVCAEPFPQTGEMPGGMLTISVGVASCPTDATTAASLISAADRALFRAKHAGRNQVRICGEPLSLQSPGLPVPSSELGPTASTDFGVVAPATSGLGGADDALADSCAGSGLQTGKSLTSGS